MGFSVTPTIDTLLAAIGAALTASGLLLAVVVGRWRKLDDHPVCRRCGYDLIGRPETSLRCSECGADLSGRKAIRIGNRRRGGMSRTGWMLLLLGLGGLGWSGYRYGRTIDWMPWMPLSWLAADLDSGNAVASRKARDEIIRRMQINLITGSNEQWLVDRLLVRHADPKWALSSDWDEVFQKSLVRGRATPEQINRYLGQVRTRMSAIFSSAIAVPDQLRRGETVTIKLPISKVSFKPLLNRSFVAAHEALEGNRSADGSRVSVLYRAARDQLSVMYTIEEVHVEGRRIAVVPRTQPDADFGMTLQPEWGKIVDLPAGTYDLRVRVHLEMLTTMRITMDLDATRPVTITSE